MPEAINYRQLTLGFDCRTVSGDKLCVSGTHPVYTVMLVWVAPPDAHDKEYTITSKLFDLLKAASLLYYSRPFLGSLKYGVRRRCCCKNRKRRVGLTTKYLSLSSLVSVRLMKIIVPLGVAIRVTCEQKSLLLTGYKVNPGARAFRLTLVLVSANLVHLRM
ncbi:hypothetical protein BDR06DRAFT_330830 [Suillus hirtellus]|nr:hypothetical protein BDR06DRAFT_330830 [Suillus hirtellus]